MDICVYTKPEVLNHKMGKVKDDDYSPIGEYVWKLHNVFPKNCEPEDKIYFAVKGYILGYFVIEELTYPDIIFNCKSWVTIKNPIAQKPFQGFKYVKFQIRP